MFHDTKKKELLKAKEKSPSITTEGKERSSTCILEWLNTGSLRKRQRLVPHKILFYPTGEECVLSFRKGLHSGHCWNMATDWLYHKKWILTGRQSPEKAMAQHSSTLAWKIPWTEEPGGLQSMGSQRVRHDWATSLSLFTFMHWRRKGQPTPVFLPGESQGRGSLVGCRLWGRTELDTTEVT